MHCRNLVGVLHAKALFFKSAITRIVAQMLPLPRLATNQPGLGGPLLTYRLGNMVSINLHDYGNNSVSPRTL